MAEQLDLFRDEVLGSETTCASAPRAVSPSSTFVPNQRLPIHRWFRYSAGFSGSWAQEVIARHAPPGGVVLDPFAGIGTTLVAAQLAGRTSVGIEAHPFVARLVAAKLLWPSDPAALERAGAEVLRRARRSRAEVEDKEEPPLLAASFTAEALVKLRALSRAIDELARGTPSRELLWLALVSILRSCSGAGTAPWQYVLPKKPKQKVADPFERFEAQYRLMASDIRANAGRPSTPARLIRGDARECPAIDDASIDLVVSSPPYPNNYDYADATRLEQTFLGEVQGWGDLHRASRQFLVRSCSQHTARDRLQLEDLLHHAGVRPIAADLTGVCQRLAEIRETKGGKKTYHTMVAAYFVDMARIWQQLARVMRPGKKACFVIGDSAPYGIHVPVDEWFARLADAVGFELLEFRELRQRNVKWKNRKHRVPLKEGELWVQRRLA